MSFTITVDVFCDVEECLRWDSGCSSYRINKKEAWKHAAARGWTRVKGKHICPICNGKASHYSEIYGYSYVEEKRP